jgi:hypothetical protein
MKKITKNCSFVVHFSLYIFCFIYKCEITLRRGSAVQEWSRGVMSLVSEGFRGEGACCAIKVYKGWQSAVPELFGAMGVRDSRRVQTGGVRRFQKAWGTLLQRVKRKILSLSEYEFWPLNPHPVTSPNLLSRLLHVERLLPFTQRSESVGFTAASCWYGTTRPCWLTFAVNSQRLCSVLVVCHGHLQQQALVHDDHGTWFPIEAQLPVTDYKTTKVQNVTLKWIQWIYRKL